MYPQAYYNVILNCIVEEFNLDVRKIPDWQWGAWRAAIKRLFDQDVFIKEITHAIPEAGEKKKWPGSTAYFKRLEDVVLKNRREREPAVKKYGMTGLGTLLNQKPNLPRT
jgi:hypothetical protein